MGSSQAGSSSSSSSSSSTTSSNVSSAAAASLASSQGRPAVVQEPQQILDEPPAALEQLQQCTVQLQEQVRAVSRLLQEVAQDQQQQQQQQQVPLRRQQRQLAWHHQPQHHALPQGQQQQQQQLRINVPADHAVFISSQPATPPAEAPKPAPFQQQQQQPLQAPPVAATAPSSAPPRPSNQPDTTAAAAGAAAGEPPMDAAQQLTHVDGSGRASMVDVAGKPPSSRSASASCLVLLGRPAFDLVKANALAKGDVLSIAQIAGIQGAKQTSALIPLCHNILLSKVAVQLSLVEEAAAVAITATAKCVGQTGVEMEALTAAGVAALTVYDMCKAVSKDIEITALRLDAKEGGKSGSWLRPTSSSSGSGSGSGSSSSSSSSSSCQGAAEISAHNSWS
uniref:cyclic pyranopterin monophosphate synthase n=1 Tax=Tetradesmus obliquus TaxID=3088 RepID=A0A383WAD2_TETOB|eukprot:jgi/Sobl393_1/15843/SZX73646.1